MSLAGKKGIDRYLTLGIFKIKRLGHKYIYPLALGGFTRLIYRNPTDHQYKKLLNNIIPF